MNLDEKIISALKDLDYEEATEIQKKAIPVALKKRDILAAAQSGTGKTAAFLLPILTEILEKKQPNIPILRALILVPTRELATQISKAVEDYAKYLNIELEYEKKENIEKGCVSNELKNLPKEFFEELNKKVLLMDNIAILILIKDYNLSNELQNHIKNLLVYLV